MIALSIVGRSIVKCRVLCGALALAITGSACGGGSDERAVKTDGSINGSEQNSKGEAPTTASTARKSALTAEALRSALLAVEDLPSRFALSPPDEESDDGGEDSYCGAHDPPKMVPSAIEKDVSFQKDTLGPFVGHTIALYSGTDEAERYMAEVRKLPDVCGSFEETEDGQTTKGTMGTMPFDRKGDETVAIKINLVGAWPVGGDLVFVRRDNLVFLVGNIAMGGVETKDTETLVSKADQKLSSIL